MFRLSHRDPAERRLGEFIHARFGLRPRNISHYIRAVTHRSTSPPAAGDGDRKGRGGRSGRRRSNRIRNDSSSISNERLEFLGDAILSAVVAEYLYSEFPEDSEGTLTETRSIIVSRKTLNRLALEMGLGEFLVCDPDIELSVSSVGGNALEAVIGAMLLDRGYRRTRKAIVERILRTHVNIRELLRDEINYKSRLLEWAQRERKTVEFRTLSEGKGGPGDTFTVSVEIDGQPMGYGEGKTKKAAERQASKKALGTQENAGT